MQILLQFLKDKSFLFALLIILLSESLLQFGCYRPFLKKSSYAQNVNHITETAVRSLPNLSPNLLIVGTSIAYEGISVKRLNEQLQGSGFVAQSIAIPGSELITQELALRKILSTNHNIKYIIHVNELQLPWVDRKKLIPSTLAMVSELDRISAIKRLNEDRYELEVGDYITLVSRWVAYRNDIADFILRPDKRLKEFGKSLKSKSDSFYAYENSYPFSLSQFKFQNLEDCKVETKKGSLIPEGSDRHHLDAIYKTCFLVADTKLTLESNELTDLFLLRLKNFYSYVRSQNIKIINIYPPVSSYLDLEDNDLRKEFWEKEFAEELNNQKFDLSRILPQEKNSDYFYDIIHLNQRGMEKFTDELARSILSLNRQ